MYFELYELFDHFIFQDGAANLANTDLICTALASIGVILAVAIPFVIVFKLINIIMDV